MSKYKVIDTTLHFVNGKLYVTETQMQDGKAVGRETLDVTEQVAQAISAYIKK
jgi:uncharacterized protein YlzI (FlbEa/FlbD family)